MVAGVVTRASSSTAQEPGILPVPTTGDTLVSEPRNLEASLSFLQTELASKKVADEERFGKLEAMFGLIAQQLANLGNSQDRSESKIVKASAIARKHEGYPHHYIPPGNQNSSIPLPIRNNVPKGVKILSEATHAKFMKMIRLDFPKYNGESDPAYWIRQAEQFFHCHEVAYEDQVVMATFHLEGHAQLWFKILYDDEGDMCWEEFCDKVYERFGPSELDNFTGELVNLKQTGSVLQYQKQFEILLSKTRGITREQRIIFFINGLKESIKNNVQICQPQTLHAAVCLAKKYEQQDEAQRRSRFQWLERKKLTHFNSDWKIGSDGDVSKMAVCNSETNVKSFNGSGSSSSAKSPAIRKLLPSEIQDRRAKGLCFSCDEKFEPGHKCRRLFLLDTYAADELEIEGQEEQHIDNFCDPMPEISLRAVSGNWAPDTMRVLATINGKTIILLLDTGSTHNFLSTEVVKTLNLKTDKQVTVAVKVASGLQMATNGQCKEVPVVIQGLDFSIDFYVLDINDYDAVIGTKWLKMLGPILWDFNDLRMTFNWNQKQVVFQGIELSSTSLITGRKFKRLAAKLGSLALIELHEEGPKLQNSQLTESQLSELENLLQEFVDLFQMPRSLPPHRECDHQIRLTGK